MGVLLTAILRALAAIETRHVGLEPRHVCLAGNELSLSAQTYGTQNV